MIFSILRFGVSANIVGATVYPSPGLVIVVPVTTPLVIDAVAVAVVVPIPTNFRFIVVWFGKYPKPELVVVIPFTDPFPSIEAVNKAVTGLVSSIMTASNGTEESV